MMTRHDIRQGVTQILVGANVAPVGNVYSYKVGSFNGKSPVVAVVSAGAETNPSTFTKKKQVVNLQVHTFVLYSNITPDWTEEDAETLMDDTYDLVIGALADRARIRSLNWDSIEQTGPSVVREIKIGGVQYLNEMIPITVYVL